MTKKTIKTSRYTATQIAKARDTVAQIFIAYRETHKLMEELQLRTETGCQSTSKPKTCHQARLTALVAPSGFGKSAHIEYFLQSEYVAGVEANGFSILHLELPADSTIKTMTTAFLDAMGDPLADKTSTAGRNSIRIVEGLKEMNCKLILIDEAQHLLGKKRRVLKDTTDWLKVLLDRAGVPVIVIGLPEILVGIKSNVQLERRMTKCIKLSPMAWDGDEGTTEFRWFLREFERQLPLSEPSDLHNPAVAHAIHQASGGLVGRVVQLITEAMEISMRRPQGPDSITQKDLCSAYYGLNLGGLNPFDRRLVPRSRPRRPQGRARTGGYAVSQASLDMLFGGGSAAAGNTKIRGIGGSLPVYNDESLPSLLARIAFARHLDDPTWICAHAGIRNGFGGLWTEEQASRMATLLGLPSAEIVSRAYLKNGTAHSFLKTTVSRQHFGWASPKICPCCIAEKGYHSAVFDLHAMRHCPQHAVALLDRCDGCGARLAFRGTQLFVCRHCGTDFRKMKAKPVDPATLACEAFVARLAGFPDLHPAIDASSLYRSSAFSKLSLGDHLQMMQTLGSQRRALLYRTKLQQFRLASKEGYMAMLEGWDLVRRWPDPFFDMLDKVSDQKSDKDGMAYGVRSTFKPLYDFLAAAEGPHWREVKHAFEIYLRDHWNGFAAPSRRNARIEVSEPTLFTQFESAYEIQRRGRMKKAELEALARSGAIKSIVVPPRVGLGKAPSIFIERAALDAIAPPGRPLLNLKAASKKIGLSIALTKRLASSGVLSTMVDPSVSGVKRYLFADTEIEAFSSRLCAQAARSDTQPHGTISLTVLLKRQSTTGVPPSNVIDAVAAGEIRSVYIGPNRTSWPWKLFLHRDDTDRWFCRHRSLASPDAVSRAEAMALLGVNKATLGWLVQSDWLIERRARGRFCPIDRKSIEAFRARWFKLGDIAEAVGTNRSTIRCVLDGGGVESLEGPADDDHDIATFYDRNHVERIDIDRLRQEAYVYKGKSRSEYTAGLAARTSALQGRAS